MTDVPDELSLEETKPIGSPRFSALRASVEIVAVVVASIVGLELGGLTGWLPMSPILGMTLPLIVATILLRREGRSWRDLGFPKKMSWGRFIGYTFVAIASIFVVSSFVIDPLMKAFGAPAPDISLLTEAIEGNTTNYLVFMVFIVWGSAAFGEELIARGFILDRVSKIFGTYVAIFVQAAIFGLAHFYQGPTGIVTIFVLAVIFGIVYVRSGRNLWPVIVAHGIIDTLGITLIYLGYSDLITGSS